MSECELDTVSQVKINQPAKEAGGMNETEVKEQSLFDWPEECIGKPTMQYLLCPPQDWDTLSHLCKNNFLWEAKRYFDRNSTHSWMYM
jgi:hypothetical protein